MITTLEILSALTLSSLIYDDYILSKSTVNGLKKIKLLTDKKTDTQGLILEDDVNKKIFIVFRGTKGETDILTDLRCIQEETKISSKNCKVHKGFLEAYDSISEQVNSISFELYPDYEIIICGHSLGGALASICAANLPSSNIIYVITFGSPRVGNDKFVSILTSKIKTYLRFVHDDDIVPMVPRINYKHAGHRIHLDDDGNEIGYRNIWKKFIYWFHGKTAKFTPVSINDHFMNNYIKSVVDWTCKNKDFTV